MPRQQAESLRLGCVSLLSSEWRRCGAQDAIYVHARLRHAVRRERDDSRFCERGRWTHVEGEGLGLPGPNPAAFGWRHRRRVQWESLFIDQRGREAGNFLRLTTRI